MTSHEDPTETLLAQSLDRQAEHAPRDHDLLDQVHARLRRRRSGRAAGALVLACAAVATGIFGVHSVLDAGPSNTPATKISPGPPPAEAGWRWESYRTIQLQVPSSWSYGTTDQPACLLTKKVAGYVGRGGTFEEVGCDPRLPKPAVRSPYVWFNARQQPVGIQTTGDGWTEETREFDGVKIAVFTGDDALRKRIFDSITPIVSTDANGCAPVLPLSSLQLPDRALASVGTVHSISVCAYGGEVLNASSKLDADKARAIVAAILAAPKGAGPDLPNCTNFSPIDLLLEVDGTAHDANVTIQYSGCAGNGASDGTISSWRLAKPYLDPLLTGPHQPSGFSDQSGLGLLRKPK
ncbi:hypothetical protein [Kribbella catacumbae]|uniref:hypothetical protein n=1 Tax=Kribbella catacumbae TaxID=460086 RepID=UPI00035C54E7|nr:hypothetical protein [Kribbella catacumbae]